MQLKKPSAKIFLQKGKPQGSCQKEQLPSSDFNFNLSVGNITMSWSSVNRILLQKANPEFNKQINESCYIGEVKIARGKQII